MFQQINILVLFMVNISHVMQKKPTLIRNMLVNMPDAVKIIFVNTETDTVHAL